MSLSTGTPSRRVCPSQVHTLRHGLGTLLVCGVAAVISVFVRLQSASGEKIQQIKWFAYAAAVLLGCLNLFPLV